MLNSCILTGNLGADPEIFYSSEGEPVATFNLAFRSPMMPMNFRRKTKQQGHFQLSSKFAQTEQPNESKPLSYNL